MLNKHKITKIIVLKKYVLLVQFENGEQKQYDLQPIISEIDAFKTLAIVNGLFEQARVCSMGYGVSWNDNIDIACEEIYKNGKSVSSEQACI
jgi:hypothetical protein